MSKYKVGQRFYGASGGDVFVFEIISVDFLYNYSLLYKWTSNFDDTLNHFGKANDETIDTWIESYQLLNSPLGKALS